MNRTMLQIAREKLGLTTGQLADRVGYHRETIRRAEWGADIRYSTALVLSRALKVPLDILLSRELCPRCGHKTRPVVRQAADGTYLGHEMKCGHCPEPNTKNRPVSGGVKEVEVPATP